MQSTMVAPCLTADNEVQTAPIATLADYRSVTSDQDFLLLMYLTHQFAGKKIIFFNSTIQGGGVALMRHALIRLFRLLAVDAHWHVMLPKQQVFEVTKRKFHNVLQAVASKDVVLDEKDKEIYQAWIQENARLFEPVLQRAHVIVIDDPQPSGLIPFIKKANPHAKIIYRSHIQIMSDLVNQPGTPQRITWDFLWNNIKEADCYVSHPLKDFLPAIVPPEKVVFMPATTDPLDGLNKPLTQDQMVHYLDFFNHCLFADKQMPIDINRPYLAQIARFDPSKGFPDVIESYHKLRIMLKHSNHPYPQLVLAGNTAIDDPDALPVYYATRDLLKSDKYADLADDVKLVQN